MTSRHYNPLDKLLIGLNQALDTVFGAPPHTQRPNPGRDKAGCEMGEAMRRHTAGLMRVNHAGEVCAQALYQGQALTARSDQVRESMQQASDEENDHLNWCHHRLQELDSHTSYLNPLWYAGSFTLGALAGLAGDRWSLGFVAETERQVVRHLNLHLEQISPEDQKTHAILEQMRDDEQQHATTALEAGARALPAPIQRLMGLTSKVMTQTAYWL